jgi:CubicO group peptidase (beta-lactamase class C family)
LGESSADQTLAEEGKLALRDPVEQYLSEFRGQHVATNLGPDTDRLSVPEHAFTIRDLLTHTAGAFGTQGWIDPKNHLISILLIQRADGSTDSLSNVFLTWRRRV